MVESDHSFTVFQYLSKMYGISAQCPSGGLTGAEHGYKRQDGNDSRILGTAWICCCAGCFHREQATRCRSHYTRKDQYGRMEFRAIQKSLGWILTTPWAVSQSIPAGLESMYV